MLGAGLITAAIIIGFLINALIPNPVANELKQAREHFSSVDTRIQELEALPTPRATPESHFARITDWAKQSGELRGAVESALGANDMNAAKSAVETLGILERNAEELARAIDAMHGKDAPRLIAAKPLVDELSTVRSTAQDISERAGTEQQTDIAASAEVLLEDIRAASARLSRLQKKTGGAMDRTLLAKSVASIKAARAEMRALLAKYVPPPTLPFKEEEATAVIAASGDLTDTLILPVLKARTGFVAEKDSEGRWFCKAEDDKIVVVRSDEAALRDLADGKVDLAIVDRFPTREESEKFAAVMKASLTSREFANTICLNALAFYVHPASSRAKITQAETKTLMCVATGSGTPARIVAERYGVLVTTTAKAPAEVAQQDRGAVAVGLFHQQRDFQGLRPLEVTGGTGRDSVAPTASAISTEEYPLSFRITAHSSPKTRPTSLEFVKFCLSDPGQDLISKQGYVDVRLKSDPPDPAIVAAIQSAVGTSAIKSIVRLSTALHFDVAEDHLDHKALADLERVPPFVARASKGAKLVIVGFTDSTGTPQINVPLSKRRADSVAAVLQQSGLSTATIGLGDQTNSPESNLTEEGRYRNRRANIYVVEL